MANVVALMTGPSASGKSTIQKELLSLGWVRPINFTTRKIRDDSELDEYVFIDENVFAKKARMGHFAEWTYYDRNLYAMTRFLDESKDVIIVVDPIGKGAFEAFLTKMNRPYFTVWVECDDVTRRERLERRRSSVNSLNERMCDSFWMKKVNPSYDIVVDGTEPAFETALKLASYANEIR